MITTICPLRPLLTTQLDPFCLLKFCQNPGSIIIVSSFQILTRTAGYTNSSILILGVRIGLQLESKLVVD